jgi:hypothetical protein
MMAELNVDVGADLMKATKEINCGDSKNKATLLYKICLRC